jgi:hypothetical protein
MASSERFISEQKPKSVPESISSPLILKQEDGERGESAENVAEHQEALQFVERHRDLFEHYARGRVNFKAAPAKLNTFAYDLKEDTIYINSRFYNKQGLSDEKTAFATLHEIEHFQEKLNLIKEKGGDRVFDKYLSRLQKSGAYKVMDNCVADVRENKTVVAKTSSSFADVEHVLYTEDLFPEIDFTDKPKHIQLPMALLREARVPGEACVVAPEVRAALDEIKSIKSKGGVHLMDIIAHPETPMSVRLRLQDRLIWPQVEKLLKEDMKDDKSKNGEGDGQQREGSDSSESNSEGQNESESTSQKPSKDSKLSKNKGKDGGNSKDPNEKFKEVYAKADEQMPHAVPIEEQKKALKEWKEGRGNPLDRADQEYANQLGVTKEELQQYRRLADEMSNVVNPETNQTAIEDLRQLIERIIAKRMKERPAPVYPTEEGDFLADPAELVSQVKAGNWEPKVWETQETRMEKGKRFGEVEISLIGDRSGSMQGQKGYEQQKAGVLFMEALKEFGDRLREESTNLDKPLSIKSEVYTFQASVEDGTPIKIMSEELSERDRIQVATKLGNCPGPGTTDFVPLEAIAKGMTEEVRRAIVDGALKKIVIVFTDGGSDDPARVARVLDQLREVGVVVIGVGVTPSGAPALTTYAPNAQLAETAEQLPMVLADTLREHLADL